MILPVGTRVMFRNGALATIVGEHRRHNGYRIRLDVVPTDNPFAKAEFVARAVDLSPTDPALHAKWEAKWPTFVDRSAFKAASQT